MPIELGVVEYDHYVDRVELARGGMGRIVTARDRRLGRTVAIKELRADTPELRARFEREAVLTARLQHPSIVSIHEAGRWASGEPFYAMKLVAGRPLDKVIGAASSLAERLALLPHVLAVADALAYAHTQRVIHRDLKPHNVLVGDYGETVVIDWGLAKDLSVSEREAALALPDGDGVLATVAGEVLGTPAYMPPEQADGQPVDERADVYAIGAILYHALAGTPPYTGNSSVEVLAAVQSAPPVPLAERQAGVPPDLHAIAERAMGREPAARYATARELADDLRRFQAGQLVGAHHYSIGQLVRRWLRRHRTAVIVAALATVALLAIGAAAIVGVVRERERADAERRRAERQEAAAIQGRKDAEQLMDFMLGDLKVKLEPIGKLDLLAMVATKARDYYRARSDEDGGDQTLRAAARRNLAEVLEAQGELAAALDEWRGVLAISERLLAKDPGAAERICDVSVARVEIGDVLARQGESKAALDEYRKALAIGEQFLARAPSSSRAQRCAAAAHASIGRFLIEQGDLASARRELDLAIDVQLRLVAAAPDDHALQHNLAVAQKDVARILMEQGDLDGAVAAGRALVTRASEVVARDPGAAPAQRDLAIAHALLGDMLFDRADSAGALDHFRASVAIMDKLAVADPSNPSRARDLALSRDRLGDALADQRDYVGALAEYRASLAAYTQQAAVAGSADALQLVAIAHQKLGHLFGRQGDARRALAEYREALAVAEQAAAKDPDNRDARTDVASARVRVGMAYMALRDHTAAQRELRVVIESLTALVATEPTNMHWQFLLANAHGFLGDTLDDTRDPAGLGEHRIAVEILSKLAAAAPENARFQSSLAAARKRLDRR